MFAGHVVVGALTGYHGGVPANQCSRPTAPARYRILNIDPMLIEGIRPVAGSGADLDHSAGRPMPDSVEGLLGRYGKA